ncbi:MAG: polyhydroxyalkanoate synthesis repressor PhaR [Gammaproteobacteria bacterium]|jgi:polyhydroxyalkanoate synthesis repressor PhaR|nr:polyhydroxyalkanoate synthesis repressor PhaR [Gammaproteobacteria bacterium]
MGNSPRGNPMSEEHNEHDDDDIGGDEDVRIIKKYPNRRIYDTQTSKYIRVDDIREMIVGGISFVVLDSKTGEDVTRSVLLQLIIEQESENNPLFTTDNLKTFIRYYGQGPHQPFGEFMNQSLSFFQNQQDQLRDTYSDMMQNNPVKAFSDMNKRNLEMWRKMSEGFYKK